MDLGGARCQGEWVVPVREEGGASGFGEGSCWYEQGKEAMVKVGAGRMVRDNEEAPNTSKTPPSQQTFKSRPFRTPELPQR